MSWIVSVAGILLAFAFMALSATINWRYGHSIGRDAADQLIYAAISLAADAAKALMPFFFWYSASNRRVMPAISTVLLWIVCTFYSLSTAAGFAELSRAEQTGGFATRKADHAGLVAELSRKEDQLKALGNYKLPAVMAQELEALRQNPKWSSTRSCADATLRDSKKFCAGYLALETERQKGLEAARLEQEIAALRPRVGELAGAAEVTGDPRAGFLVRLTGWDVFRIQTGYSILFIVVLELGSGLGLFIALSHGGLGSRARVRAAEVPAPLTKREARAALPASSPAPEKAKPQTAPPPGDVAKFARACLVAAKGHSISFDQLYTSYEQWCAKQRHRALDKIEFDRHMLRLCDKVGFQHKMQCGVRFCIDVKTQALLNAA